MKSSPLLPASTWADDLASQVERLGGTIELEAVHRLRVAAGRMSVWLELGARRALRDDLRALRRSASEVRDLDVIAARDTSPQSDGATWAETLRDERAEAAARLRISIAAPRVAALLEALALVPEPDAVCVRSALQRLKRRVQRAGDDLDDGEGRDESLHRLRRRIRRLRYALDWMGADASQLRAMQDLLGDLNNLAVELTRLEARDGDRALDARRTAVRHEIEARRSRALAAWTDLRPKIGDL